MNWQIVSAVCAAASVLAGALNAYQNVRIELRVERLRNELLVQEIGPLRERIATLEAELDGVRANCPLMHGARSAA